MFLIFFLITTGADFTAAVVDSALLTWGCGKYGVLGHGDEKNLFTPTPVNGINIVGGLACGAHHIVAWSSMPTHTMYSWGLNSSGQLGHGHTKNLARPQEIKAFPTPKLISVSCGAAHTIVVTYEIAGSKTWGFGSNSCGQLALDEVGQGSKIVSPQVIQSLRGAVGVQEVACGALHSLARTESGVVYATGSNTFGQLGFDSKGFVNRFTVIKSLKGKNPRSISCGGTHSFVMCPKTWLKDDDVTNCMKCRSVFTFIKRKHHCRNCCGIFCNDCSSRRIAILTLKLKTPQRVCDACYVQIKGG